MSQVRGRLYKWPMSLANFKNKVAVSLGQGHLILENSSQVRKKYPH